MSKKHQVKSRMYYYFWSVCTVTVLLGQLYVGAGYRVMAESVNRLTFSLVGELEKIGDTGIDEASLY